MPRRDASYDDDDDDDGEIPWDALGRGTAAGRALFNLYNGLRGCLVEALKVGVRATTV